MARLTNAVKKHIVEKYLEKVCPRNYQDLDDQLKEPVTKWLEGRYSIFKEIDTIHEAGFLKAVSTVSLRYSETNAWAYEQVKLNRSVYLKVRELLDGQRIYRDDIPLDILALIDKVLAERASRKAAIEKSTDLISSIIGPYMTDKKLLADFPELEEFLPADMTIKPTHHAVISLTLKDELKKSLGLQVSSSEEEVGAKTETQTDGVIQL